MFSRSNPDASTAPRSPDPVEPRPAPPAAARPFEGPRASDRGASVLGPDLRIRGGIEGRGEIQLQGRAWGDVQVERLLLTEPAELEGSIVAQVVEIRGRVVGPVTAQTVRLLPTARVEGDITYETLQIDPGAQLEGRCIRIVPARTEAAEPKAEARPAAPARLSAPAEPAAQATGA